MGRVRWKSNTKRKQQINGITDLALQSRSSHRDIS